MRQRASISDRERLADHAALSSTGRRAAIVALRSPGGPEARSEEGTGAPRQRPVCEPAPFSLALPALSRTAPVADVVVRALADGAVRLFANDRLIRAGGDAEAVHQARVATRRLRSDLRTFRGVVDRRWSGALRAELSWLAQELGAARDCDVLHERLERAAETLPAGSAAGADELLGALADRRAQAHAALLEVLRGVRYLALIDRVIEAARVPALREDEAARPAVEVLPRLSRRTWRALERRVCTLAAAPTAEELHGVRIAAKRCRYVAETCAPLLGGRVARLAHAAKGLQDALGDANDAILAERWLREWAASASSGAAAFAAGELALVQRETARRAASRWPKAWKRVLRAAGAMD